MIYLNGPLELRGAHKWLWWAGFGLEFDFVLTDFFLRFPGPHAEHNIKI